MINFELISRPQLNLSLDHAIPKCLRETISYRVSHKEVQVFSEVFLNIQNIFFKDKFFNRIEERST